MIVIPEAGGAIPEPKGVIVPTSPIQVNL